MSKIKKLLCILISAMLLFALAACGNTGSSSEGKKDGAGQKSDKDIVEGVVTDYMDVLCDLNLKEASTYLDLDEDAKLPFEDEDDFVDKVFEEALASNEMFEGLEEEFQPIIEIVRDAIKDSLEYEILETDVDGDEATVKINFTVIDTDAVNFDNIDFDDVDFDFEGYFQELLESGAISESSSQDEMLKAFMPKIVELMSDKFQETLDNADTTTDEIELKLEKSGDKWIITDPGETFDSFDDIAA
ncbi:MAG: hypothetical protein J5590_04950 [Clostridia bacterium]|nr:hypothetical protein [Clostridia bacterium]